MDDFFANLATQAVKGLTVLLQDKETFESALRSIFQINEVNHESPYQPPISPTDPDYPFIFNSEMREFATLLKKQNGSDKAVARAIFDWVDNNIFYDIADLPKRGYRTALEVWETKKGVCGEMSALFITLCRLAGLHAQYVSVDRDRQGKEVKHACAVVWIEGKEVFVDPGYHVFDIKHMIYQVKSDAQTVEYFKALRTQHRNSKRRN